MAQITNCPVKNIAETVQLLVEALYAAEVEKEKNAGANDIEASIKINQAEHRYDALWDLISYKKDQAACMQAVSAGGAAHQVAIASLLVEVLWECAPEQTENRDNHWKAKEAHRPPVDAQLDPERPAFAGEHAPREIGHRILHGGRLLAVRPHRPPAGGSVMVSKRNFRIYAATDAIGGDVMDTKYRREWLVVEPLAADFAHACFAVIALSGGGTPRLVWLDPTRHDGNGRFCKAGSPRQAISVMPFGWHFSRCEVNDFVFVLGRLVDQNRPPIATLSSLQRAEAA